MIAAVLACNIISIEIEQEKKMKKGILLLGVGAAAGVVYALEANWRKQNKQANGNGESATEPESSENGRIAATASAETDDSGEQSERASSRSSSMARVESGTAAVPESEDQHVIDDQGTDQFEASQILRHIRDNAFEASDEKLALALGRPTEEIEQWTSGIGSIDGDVIMKARALAIQRGLEF